MRTRGISTLQLAAVLAGISILLMVVLQMRTLMWSAHAEVMRDTVRDFAEAIAQYHKREGMLPGDVNRDGELDALEATYVASHLARAGLMHSRGSDLTVARVVGSSVSLRLISRRASAVPGFPAEVRNVIELRGVPCHVAEELDARTDDGKFSTGNLRANVTACAVAGLNDPVPVLAVALRP